MILEQRKLAVEGEEMGFGVEQEAGVDVLGGIEQEAGIQVDSVGE